MKYVLLIVFVLILATMAFIFGWLGSDSQSLIVTAPVIEAEVVNDVNNENTHAEEERYAAIQAEYKKLEKARRNLDRRLARIKAILWNVELPEEQTEDIVSKMRKGYELLKSKKLLGAFTGLQSIRDELARVEYTHQNLEGIIDKVKAAKISE